LGEKQKTFKFGPIIPIVDRSQFHWIYPWYLTVEISGGDARLRDPPQFGFAFWKSSSLIPSGW